jgi:transposase-like protein
MLDDMEEHDVHWRKLKRRRNLALFAFIWYDPVVLPTETGQATQVESGPPTGDSMGRKPRVERTPEEKWQIVQEGLKSGNVSETCRRHGIAQTLYYRWKNEAEKGAKTALGGKTLRPGKARRIVASGSWNERWDANHLKLKS